MGVNALEGSLFGGLGLAVLCSGCFVVSEDDVRKDSVDARLAVLAFLLGFVAAIGKEVYTYDVYIRIPLCLPQSCGCVFVAE